MLRVFSAHTLGNVVTLADRFLLLPIMVYVWGANVAGVWLTIRSLPAVLSVGELGFASATGNRMTERMAEQDEIGAARVYWSTSRLINFISLICLVLTLVATLTLPLSQWFKGSLLAAWEFNAAVFLMAIYTVSIFQTQLYYAGYRSIHRQATAAFGTHLMRVGELLLVIVALFTFKSVVSVALGYLIARLTGALWLRRNLLREAKWLDTHREASSAEARALLRPALGYAALPFAQTFQLQGSTLVVAAMSTPEMVAAFTAMRTLARFPIQFCSTLGRTVWPELTQALAHGQTSRAEKLYYRMMWGSFGFSCASVIALLLLGPWVYEVWTSKRLAWLPNAFMLLAIGSGLTAYAMNAMTMLNATSQHGRASTIWAALALLSLAVPFVVPGIDIAGICWVLLLTELVALIFVTWTTQREMKELKTDTARPIASTSEGSVLSSIATTKARI